MSSSGAMIETPLLPLTGTTVHLIRGSLVAQATVIWGANGRCGLQFASQLSVKEWLAAPATAEQHRVDAIVARVKAEAAASTEVPRAIVAPRPPRTHEQLIDDLGAVGRLMQDLEDDLASSDDTIVRHGAKLIVIERLKTNGNVQRRS